MGYDTSWSSEELSSIDLGDARLNQRCQRAGGHPRTHTWHHSETLGRMELVEKAAHKPFAHEGGRTIFETLVDAGIIP
jgi:hypothetical protein